MNCWRSRIVSRTFVVGLIVLSTGCATPFRGGQVDAQSLQRSFREVAAFTLPSIVQIDVEEVQQQGPGDQFSSPWFDFFMEEPDTDVPQEREFRSQGLGSGIVVERVGGTYYVLTNNHVIGNADAITVRLDSLDEYPAQVVGRDTRKDLAMVSFESEETIPLARLGDSDVLQVGDWVLALGSPYGFQSTVTAGIVSALGRRGGPSGNISDFIQTDAAINRGNSGGALVNLNGEVVGINTWITTQTGGSVGLGFSIPINNVARVIDDFIETGAVQYGWLGVIIRSLDDDLRDSLRIPSRDGAFVHHIFLDSPAAKGGLMPGDTVVAIDGVPIKTSDELVLMVGEFPVEQVVTFDLLRGGEREVVSVEIGQRESEAAIANLNTRLWPGFTVYPLTDELRLDSEIPADLGGLVVSNVEPRSPGALSEARVGDVITHVDGRPVADLLDFYQLLNAGGESIDLTVSRNGVTTKLQLEQ